MTEPASTVPGRSASVSPEALFVVGGIAQYAGASIAVHLFDEASPQAVALFRIFGGALALLIVAGRRAWRGWTAAEVRLVLAFGVATALMNLSIYLAFDRLDLGKAVAIEFLGPIVVAALATRSRQNAVALGGAVAGVILLSQFEFDALGTTYVLLASMMWAGYIVTGWRVARLQRGLDGLAIGMLAGSVALVPFAAAGRNGGIGAVTGAPGLLLACLAVGVLSSAIPYGIDQTVLRRITARRFAVLQALLPVIAALMGMIVLDQFPRPIEYAGIVLVLTAVALQARD